MAYIESSEVPEMLQPAFYEPNAQLFSAAVSAAVDDDTTLMDMRFDALDPGATMNNDPTYVEYICEPYVNRLVAAAVDVQEIIESNVQDHEISPLGLIAGGVSRLYYSEQTDRLITVDEIFGVETNARLTTGKKRIAYNGGPVEALAKRHQVDPLPDAVSQRLIVGDLGFIEDIVTSMVYEPGRDAAEHAKEIYGAMIPASVRNDRMALHDALLLAQASRWSWRRR